MEQATYWLTAIIVSGAAFLVSLATFVRTGDWKRTDAGKEVERNISSLGSRLTVVETDMKHLPSRADFATLASEVEAVQEDIGIIRAGIVRIEDHLLRDRK